MRIFIDIGHPAHVHYFRNFIKIMKNKGNTFFITARDKDIVFELLKAYHIIYHSRGRGSNSRFGKILYMFKADIILYRFARNFKPDLFISFASPYAAQVSKLSGVQHYAFDDTEAATKVHFLYRPFTEKVFTPSCYNTNFGTKQYRFNGFMELCYLHPKYFTPDITILKELGIEENEKYVLVRFVAWKGNHDFGECGIYSNNKKNLIDTLTKYAKVFITSEGDLPIELERYRITIAPERMHHALAFSSLLIGESPTMTTESAILGIPAICISSWAKDCGNFIELKKYGLIYSYLPSDEMTAFKKAEEILSSNNKNVWKERSKKLLSEKIDVTEFLVNVVEKFDQQRNANINSNKII
jgi:predicted glycosyltransferase